MDEKRVLFCSSSFPFHFLFLHLAPYQESNVILARVMYLYCPWHFYHSTIVKQEWRRIIKIASASRTSTTLVCFTFAIHVFKLIEKMHHQAFNNQR